MLQNLVMPFIPLDELAFASHSQIKFLRSAADDPSGPIAGERAGCHLGIARPTKYVEQPPRV